jgi:class 3 adenylate cyclase
MDYTIIGGAVNLASRLEHEAPPGGILISYETYALVKEEVRCEEMGRIRCVASAIRLRLIASWTFMPPSEPSASDPICLI